MSQLRTVQQDSTTSPAKALEYLKDRCRGVASFPKSILKSREIRIQGQVRAFELTLDLPDHGFQMTGIVRPSTTFSEIDGKVPYQDIRDAFVASRKFKAVWTRKEIA